MKAILLRSCGRQPGLNSDLSQITSALLALAKQFESPPMLKKLMASAFRKRLTQSRSGPETYPF
ncbi:Hypothetical protein FKW44_013209 [Caligus rogercresseyi]|uniref:Uncharacterized protein n=1 Tax=Caligus rogercresseyi TaxID=217165 RepID=A0A7T8HKK1_CALRO|nr:Hypothetical protein FKW44_013209 [Caligus rogercresseyi]